VKAYDETGSFAAFCESYYGGPWSWAGVIGAYAVSSGEQRRGLAKRSVAARFGAAQFYGFLNATRGLR